MKSSILAVALVTGIGIGSSADDTPAAAPDQKEVEKMMLEAGKVGPHHEHLQKMVGDWTVESTDYSSGESKTQPTGSATFESLMGGRYVRQTFKGEYNGMAFEGLGLMGYDNAQQKFVGSWIDNFSTGILQSTGTLDEKTGVLTEIGELATPLGPMKFKTVYEPPTKDRMDMTMFLLNEDGSETKQMSFVYRRKK